MNSVGTMICNIRTSSSEPGVTLGKICGSVIRREKLTDSEQNHHVHIVGASGFGKTVLISHIVQQRIEQGHGLMFVDLKGDIETIRKFQNYAKACGRESDIRLFSLGHVDQSSTYNLLGKGTPTQIRDRIMMSLVWSEEFYKNQAASFLLKLLIGVCWLRDRLDKKLDLHLLHEILSSRDCIDGLCGLIPMTEIDVRKPIEEIAQSIHVNDYWNSLQGLRTQIESLVLSDFSDLILSTSDGIDLFRAVSDSKLVFVFLDSRRYGETAKVVGKFILQDLKGTSARIDAEVQRSDRKPFSVIIDEFSDLAQEDFIAFLDRARSSRMAVTVAHQEISDLQRISPEFAGRLIGNTATMYAFLQKGGESAELIASVAGTKRTLKETECYSRKLFMDFATGETSKREVEEFVIHPNVIKTLRVGECVCIKKYPYSRAHKMKVDFEKPG